MNAVTVDREGQIEIDLEKLYGNSMNVMGLKRTGKTNTGTLFLEGWMDAGLPLTFVDPHNEGWGLKYTASLEPSNYQILVAGRGKRADVPLNAEHAADLAEFSYKNRISVVLSLFRIGEEERFAILNAYFGRLWELAEQAYDDEEVQSYGIALEEAPTYLPQNGTNPIKPLMKKVVQEGGKFGFTTFLITQRSQDIDKAILGQGAIYLLHKVIHPRDKEVYKGIVPESGERVEKRIQSLKKGDAILIDEGVVQVVHVKLQKTLHVGVTPGAKQPQAPNISLLDTAILEQLRAMMKTEPKPDPLKQEIERLLKRVEELETVQFERDQEHEHVVAEKETQIRDLQTQLGILGKLDLTVDSSNVLNGEKLPSVMHLESLTTSVERATIDVRKLLGTDLQNGENAEELLALFKHPLFISHLQELESDNERLQAEVSHLRSRMEEQEAQATLVGNGVAGTRSRETVHTTTVHFENASIDTFYAGSGVAVREQAAEREEGISPSVSVTPVEEAPVLPLTGQALLNALLRSERKSFSKLLSLVQELSSSEKVLFIWLIEHDGQQVSSQQLADAVNRDIYVTWSQYTEKLVKISFIQRWRDGKFWYKAACTSYCTKYFSSVPASVLVQELVKVAS